MYVVIVAGGIASGKSTFGRELGRCGATRVDLDAISREVLTDDLRLVASIAEAFGPDVVDGRTGAVRRDVLAERAFASAERAAHLEALELPAIKRRLEGRLEAEAARVDAPACVVVEVPLLDRLGDPHAFADEVVAVVAPAGDRLRRAVERGMDEADARARMSNQPDDAWLCAHADLVIENTGSEVELLAAAHAWWSAREASGWTCVGEG